MKHNFVVGLFGSLIGSALVLIILSATGAVSARGGDIVQTAVSQVKEASASPIVTSTFTYQGQFISVQVS